MNRRYVLSNLAGTAGVMVLGPGTSQAQQPKSRVPGAIALEIGKEMTIAIRSAPVKVEGSDLHIVFIDKGIFHLDMESRLTATLKAGVTQYAKVDYWISAAVFDPSGKLLGVAVHKEPVEYIRLGRIPTVFRDIALDFGISNAFKDAAFVSIAISERDVPKPG